MEYHRSLIATKRKANARTNFRSSAGSAACDGEEYDKQYDEYDKQYDGKHEGQYGRGEGNRSGEDAAREMIVTSPVDMGECRS